MVEAAGGVAGVAGAIAGSVVVVAAGGVVVVVVVVASSEPEQAVSAKRAEAQRARESFFMSKIHLFELHGP